MPVHEGILIERDVSIPMDDGISIKCDVFRPKDGQPAPVIMTLGPYAKGAPYSVQFAPQWKWLVGTHPDMLPGSSRELMNWETADAEMWVPLGYVCIRVDSRGAGRSPGRLDIFSPREIRDYHDAIEWAAAQPWSTGKVGLNGISYYAINQWLVASLQPPHLACIIPWEGAGDFYRDFGRHGGIQSNAFVDTWFNRQVVSTQHGNPNSILDPWLNERISGPASLGDDELKQNRADPVEDILHRPLDGEWYRERSPDWSKVKVPFLSAASLGGHGLHARGNFEAFTQAASSQKWLETHTGRHEELFYLTEGMALQQRFLDHFLKGAENGWDREPPVLLSLRKPFTDAVEHRKECSWPLTGTQWTKAYLNSSNTELLWDPTTTDCSVSFKALETNVTFRSQPLRFETEITGPIALKVFAASTTTDLDLFVTFQAFSPNGREVDFQGTIDPHTPLSQGWLRASHRKLDTKKTLAYRPYHSHDELQPLTPGEIYELDIELWPTSIVLPAGFEIAVHIGGKDFERPLPPDVPNEAWVARGSGPWLHNHKKDRPSDVFGGTTTLFTGGQHQSYLYLPVIQKD
ncbi:hypothetical protein H2200_004050 [Cladophialophora chaetospira]|uniref:Xaa-Pro dipeptidyl-peptidase C-terminal domain-containing protein n=1 Tax=Cladophialophora chaetospira TaxID=386627 RepID=A0AA39CLQ0_9EURO|nr:hypothetical protein H2200_004050 [Cladophialophora chaetospira]